MEEDEEVARLKSEVRKVAFHFIKFTTIKNLEKLGLTLKG